MSELEKGCHRSHPHEEMNEICRLKTQLAQVTADNERLSKEKDEWAKLAGSFTQGHHEKLVEIEQLKIQLQTAKAEGVRTQQEREHDYQSGFKDGQALGVREGLEQASTEFVRLLDQKKMLMSDKLYLFRDWLKAHLTNAVRCTCEAGPDDMACPSHGTEFYRQTEPGGGGIKTP